MPAGAKITPICTEKSNTYVGYSFEVYYGAVEVWFGRGGSPTCVRLPTGTVRCFYTHAEAEAFIIGEALSDRGLQGVPEALAKLERHYADCAKGASGGAEPKEA